MDPGGSQDLGKARLNRQNLMFFLGVNSPGFSLKHGETTLAGAPPGGLKFIIPAGIMIRSASGY